jgi:hypothetical protein
VRRDPDVDRTVRPIRASQPTAGMAGPATRNLSLQTVATLSDGQRAQPPTVNRRRHARAYARAASAPVRVHLNPSPPDAIV